MPRVLTLYPLPHKTSCKKYVACFLSKVPEAGTLESAYQEFYHKIRPTKPNKYRSSWLKAHLRHGLQVRSLP